MLKEIYKSLVALSLLISPFCLVGCGDDVDKIEDNQEVNNSIQISDLVGTWEIVHSTYTYKVNGVVKESASGDVSDEHNRIVIYPDGSFEFLEYSDYEGTWHEDGKGTLYMRNGQLECVGDFKEFKLISFTKTKIVVKYKFVEEEDGTINEEEYTNTMERVEQITQ